MSLNSTRIPSVLERPVVSSEAELLLYFKRALAFPLAADIDMVGDAVVSAALLALTHVRELEAVADLLPNSSHAGLPTLDFDTLSGAARLARDGDVAAAYERLSGTSPAPRDSTELLASMSLRYSALTELAANITTALTGADRLIAQARLVDMFSSAATAEINALSASDGIYGSDIRHELLGADTAARLFTPLASAYRCRKASSAVVTSVPADSTVELRFLPALISAETAFTVNSDEVALPASQRAYVEFDAACLRVTTDRVYYGVYPDLPQLRDNAAVSMHIYRADGTSVTVGSPAAAGDVLYISYTYSLLTGNTRTLTVLFDNEEVVYDTSGTAVSPLDLSTPATLAAALQTAGATVERTGSVLRIIAPAGVYSANIPTTTVKRVLAGDFDDTWSAEPQSLQEVLGGVLAPLTLSLAAKLTYEELELPAVLAAYTGAVRTTSIAADSAEPQVVQLNTDALAGDELRFTHRNQQFIYRITAVDGTAAELDTEIVFFGESSLSARATLCRKYLRATGSGAVEVTGYVEASAVAPSSVVRVDLPNTQILRVGDVLRLSSEDAVVTAIHPVLRAAGNITTESGVQVESGFLRSAAPADTVAAFADSYSTAAKQRVLAAAAAMTQRSAAAAPAYAYMRAVATLKTELERLAALGARTNFHKLVQSCAEARLPAICRYLRTANFLKLSALSMDDLGQSSSI